MNNERLTEQAAAYKSDARRLFEDAVVALIALAFRYKNLGANFLWDSDPVLEREANAILRRLSDKARESAKARALELIREADLAEGEYAWDSAEDAWGEPVLTRLDMVGSHLRELLEIWIALAFVEGMTPSYLKICVLRYLSSPYASPMWSRLPAGLLKWGKGYQRNLIDQIALIGQTSIIGAVRFAEWSDASSRGAAYYIRRRASTFDCPECESLANKPIPISVPWENLHARCVCYAEFYDADGNKLE